jgi:hypothetical protein
MTNMIEDFFFTGGIAAKMPNIGDSVEGTIKAQQTPEGPKAATVRQATEFGTNLPATWSDGRPKMEMVINLQTQESTGPDDDGTRVLYVSKIAMRNAIAQALVQANVRAIEISGWLKITRTADTPSGKGNPSQGFTAEYKAPTGAVQVEAPVSVDEAEQVLASAGLVEDKPAAHGGYNAQTQKVLQFLRMGSFSHKQIATRMSLDVDVVDAIADELKNNPSTFDTAPY